MYNENLWAPWRMAYLRELNRRREVTEVMQGGVAKDVPGESFLRRYWEHPESDAKQFVVFRNESGMVLLNRYPYANGHLLVALGDARPTLLDYDRPQRDAFWRLIEFGSALMDRALNPQGINFGINQGDAAGAGVPEHLHAHLVPRWRADTNFVNVVGGVRVIPDALEAMYERYRQVLSDVAIT